MEVRIIKIYIRGISRRIKSLREEKKLTQEELAEQLGVSRQSVISVEHGKCLPSLPLALRLAEIFHQTFEEIFLGESQQKITKGGEKTMPRYLMPWSPFGDLDNFFDEGSSARAPFFAIKNAIPPVDVRQTQTQVIVTADIPGVKEEDIQIEVGDDFVKLCGERKEEKEEKEAGYLRREVRYGSFERSISLPTEVLTDKAEATIVNGQLKIVLPKKESSKPKVTKIKVKKA